MKKKLFDNKTDYAVLAFIILLVLMLGYCEDSKADVALEYAHDSNSGITEWNQGLDRICVRNVFKTGTSLVVCPVVAVGGDISRDSFELGVADELWRRWEGQITMTRYDGTMYGGGTIRRVVGDGPFQMLLGLTGWITESPGSNSGVTFNLGLRYTF